MSAVLKRAAGWLGFSEPANAEYDEYTEEETFDNEELTEGPTAEVYPGPGAPVEESEELTPDLSRIVTTHPQRFEQVVKIGEAFREGVPVIMNLTNMSEKEARRVIDFASGMSFALHGTIEKVTSMVFLISPQSVKIEDGAEPGVTTLRRS